MAQNRKEKKMKEFPEVDHKLLAPTKKSLFERQKAEAEAKRLREEAETAAVLEDFVKSFDDEDIPSAGGNGFGIQDNGRFGNAGFSGPPKRHFSSTSSLPTGPGAGRAFGSGRGAPMSGPGSLGPPPMSLSKKRSYETSHHERRRDDRGLLAFDDYDRPSPPSKALKTSDDEDEKLERAEDKAVAKPTLRLASLPPTTSPAVIKALLPASLTIDAVRILPSSGPGTFSERKSLSAIVTLASDTAANDIDAAVNSLQNKYLGYGHYLSLHRHLSSAAISAGAPVPSLGSSTASQPFGAKPVPVAPAGRGRAPPTHQRGFAPPTSYAPSGPGQSSRGPILHVPVQPPQDIKELKLIHKVIESLLTHGPEFEALLMSRSDVQKEEKWAWLWNSRSLGGVWYRWRLWEVLTGTQTRRGQGKYLPLFEGSSAWKAPDMPLPYEYTTRLDEFVSDSEYNSSDDEDSGDEGARRQHHNGGAPDPSSIVDDGKAYLNPLEKAKLTHLLSRLPTSTGKLRKGDIARVTAFAISHAGRGADEVVQAIVSNIEKPFAYTSANPDRPKDKEKDGSGDDRPEEEQQETDTSSACLIGIYIISDILSSSSTSGVRHAWRYRQLFETALKQRHVFERLGRMEKRMNWGRLRAEKWKRSVGNMLSLWEGWCVFPQESQEHFVKMFNEPPSLKGDEEAELKKKEEAEKEKARGKWKAVEVVPESEKSTPAVEEDVAGEPMDEDEDVDGVPMQEDDDVDGEPMEEDIDGEPMVEDEEEQVPHGRPAPAPQEETKDSTTLPMPVKEALPLPGQPRRRPRAVDMFADSDDED